MSSLQAGTRTDPRDSGWFCGPGADRHGGGGFSTINWTAIVRSPHIGHQQRSLKQGVWTYRQDMAESDGGGWFHAKDQFEATWVTEQNELTGALIEPEPHVYLEEVQDTDHGHSKGAAATVWRARMAELRGDHLGLIDPTFLRYIRAFPAAMDDDVIMDQHRVLLQLPSDTPQCRGCHYCRRAMRRKHCDKMLANSTLDGPARGDARQKIQGLPPKPIGKPLNRIQTWPAPQDEFPRALFPLREFNASGLDARGRERERESNNVIM
jgi:hypothetical protein